MTVTVIARKATGIAAVTVLAAAAAALVVRALGLPVALRRVMEFTFEPPPRDLGGAAAVAATNLRFVAAALVAAATVHWRPQLRPGLDITLGAVITLNAGALGVALGAYGARLLEAVAVHAPVELAAFALAGGVYGAARAQDVTATAFVAAAAGSVGLTLAGAFAETYVQIGGTW